MSTLAALRSAWPLWTDSQPKGLQPLSQLRQASDNQRDHIDDAPGGSTRNPERSSWTLLHQVSGGFEGQATDIEIQAREVISVKRRLEEIIAEHSGQPLERVSKDMERDYFMTPEEAREYGVIDRVITHH
jgi:hypothetical protein